MPICFEELYILIYQYCCTSTIRQSLLDYHITQNVDHFTLSIYINSRKLYIGKIEIFEEHWDIEPTMHDLVCVSLRVDHQDADNLHKGWNIQLLIKIYGGTNNMAYLYSWPGCSHSKYLSDSTEHARHALIVIQSDMAVISDAFYIQNPPSFSHNLPYIWT